MWSIACKIFNNLHICMWSITLRLYIAHWSVNSRKQQHFYIHRVEVNRNDNIVEVERTDYAVEVEKTDNLIWNFKCFWMNIANQRLISSYLRKKISQFEISMFQCICKFMVDRTFQSMRVCGFLWVQMYSCFLHQ